MKQKEARAFKKINKNSVKKRKSIKEVKIKKILSFLKY